MKLWFSHPYVLMTTKVIVSIALLIGLLYYIDVKAVQSSFLNADLQYLSIGILLAIAQLIIHFFRWRYLLRLISVELTNREVMTSLFVGIMAGFFTPGQIGEFAGRIASHPGMLKSHVVGITVIDKLYLMAVTYFIGIAGIVIFIADQYPIYWNHYFDYPVIIFLTLIIIVFLNPEKVREILLLLPQKIRQHRFYETIQVCEDVFNNKNAVHLFAMTSVLYATILAEYYFIVSAFGYVSFGDTMMCTASILFVKAVVFPISFGDLGIREGVSVFFFEHIGTAAAVAFNASIIISIISSIFPAAIGALLVTTLKKSK